MIWHRGVIQKLTASGLFYECFVIGAKIRAPINDTLFLDIYYDPTTKSYSYGLVDSELPYKGDKRILGWDDYPHEGIKEMKALKSYPHHFQFRKNEKWVFDDSPLRGDIMKDIEVVIKAVSEYLRSSTTV
ncbi:MAG: hypothetical protein JW878_02290 [Methanomicrobia archaeon]|nr:hypothetical protein [Methanomicrobia archaeon]